MTEPTIILDDRQSAEINRLLPWLFAQLDQQGMIVGYGRTWPLIDDRIRRLAGAVNLNGLRVLEPGCLDGQLTVALCAQGADVTCFDVRPSGAVKTFARCAAFGFHPRVLIHDAREMEALGTFDLIVHVGVLYHLADPVSHLRRISNMAPVMMVDTHTAIQGRPLEMVNGYEGMWYAEGEDEQSGMEPRSFWLTKDSLCRAFDECGFDWEVMHEHESDNGPCGQYLLRKR